MKCKICESVTSKVFTAKILNKYSIGYYNCNKCRFLQTEEPYWLDEAYKFPINLSDTGIVQRNIVLAKRVSLILFMYFGKDASFLDYAGGYGLFSRLMRDIGYNYLWMDPFTTNLFAKGFEYKQDIPIKAITAFETFEHFVNPLIEIEKILEISSNIIFTTELLPNFLPNTNEWWYYGLDHGQHISFYNIITLKYIANKYNLNFITDGKIHLFTKQKINHSLYSFLLITARFGSYKIISKLMNSKTFSDMQKMKLLSIV
jgi:hypothetical protein